MRKLSLFALLSALFALATTSANAQLGIYGEFNATHDPTVADWYKGLAGGVYYNPLHFGPAALGLDLHGAYEAGGQYSYRNALIGPRLEIKPPILPIRPYVQASVGVGGSKFTGFSALGTHFTNKLQYGVSGGIDYTLIPYIDLRLVDIGYLRMTGITSGLAAPAVNLVTVGAGVVFRIP